MKPVTYRLLTNVGGSHWTVDASDLGLKPGQFPDVLEVTKDFGNGKPLMRKRTETWGVGYQQRLGTATLMVFDD